jgi:superfamily II DNA helicase RecQ
MDAFTQVFDHHSLYRIIICRTCAFAVPPKHIVTHLRNRHRRVPVAERGAIAAAVRGLRDLAWHQEDLHLPRVAEEPIPGLVNGTNGRVCQWEGCMYTCTTQQGITTHCKEQHGWINDQKRGGDARKKSAQPANRLWADNQPYQRVFRASGWPAYVALRAEASQQNEEDMYEQVRAERDRIEEQEAVAAAQDTIKEGTHQLPDPWLELTGWPSHLKGRRRAELLSAKLVPEEPGESSRHVAQAEGEADLARACNAMRRLISKAFKTARPEFVGRPALEVIERRETGAESNEKPFYSNHKASTIHRYSEKLVSVLCYLWRTCHLEPSPYALSFNQEALMESIKRKARQEGRRSSKDLQRACLRFWISLLDHGLADDEYKNALLSGIVVLGLKPDHLGGGWYPAHEFSPVLSALITTSKALVLYAAYREWVGSRADSAAVPSVHELVRDMAERFMQLSSFQGTVTPMNRMLRLRTLARTLAKQRNTSGLVAWDRDRILIDRQSFTLVDLQGMIKGLYETVRQRLLTDVLLLDMTEDGRVRPGSAALPPLSMELLVDQPAELSAGFSFLKHPDNHFDAWHDWLLRRVMLEPALKRRFRTGANSERWCDGAVYAYMKGVRKFKEGLFALVHLSAGAPARGTEVTSILCENDVSGVGYRGIFVEGGLIAFVTTYHKGYSFSKNVKTIHRYVPREVSELVVYFLALARPFIVDVQKMHGGVRGCTAFLWEPPPEQQEGDDSEADSEDDGAEGDAREYEADQGGDETDTSEEGEADDEHRRVPRTEKRTSANPDGFWGTDRIRRVLREYTSMFMGATLGTRTWRHAYPAIHRNLGTDSKARDVVDMLYWNKELATDDARALQSGHTVWTEESGYGRLLLESPYQTHREREQFRSVSVDWHRLLGFASAYQGSHMHPGQTAALIAQQDERASVRWAALASADLRANFRALVKEPEAEFRSKQQEALVAISQRRLRVLVVMATGAGKSMLFMLPAAIVSTGVTVVIALLNALRDDLLDRCERMGIQAAKWDGKRPPYWARIVLVTPEGAVSPSFGRFLDEKRTLRELDRIVVDECHVLMESSEAWRPDVLKLTQMTEKGTQVVYMTATLPPTLQPTFLQVAGLDERSLTVCRDPRTSRPNIAYQVADYDREDLEPTLTRLVARKREQFGEDAQIIVYCRQVKQTQSLAKHLRCAAYYSGMGTEEEKTCRVRAFASGVVKTCTATNMLGLGLDAPGVRVVIHVDMCFLLRQYVQESGRAGRSGLPSESIVLNPVWRTKTGEKRSSTSSKLDAEGTAFMTSTVCRRIAIDSHMDGREDRRQCEVGEATCDLCTARSRGTKRLVAPTQQCEADAESNARATRRKLETAVSLEERQIEIQQRRNAEQRNDELKQLDGHLSRWRGACVLCMATTDVHQGHEWQQCPHADRQLLRHLERNLGYFGNIPWQPYACCTACSAPQAICNRWAETDRPGLFKDRGPGLCQYEDVLVPAVAALFTCHYTTLLRWARPALAQYQFPSLPAKITNIVIVLGKKTRLGGQDASQMATVFHSWGEGLLR